jgi:hypothetical protein
MSTNMFVHDAEVYIAPFDNGRVLSMCDIEELLADNLELPTTSTRPTTSHPTTLTTGAAAAFALQLYMQQGSGASTTAAPSGPNKDQFQAMHATYQHTHHMQQQQQQMGLLHSIQHLAPPQQGPSPPWFSRLLRPSSSSAILMRLLRNLREVHWVPVLRKQVRVYTCQSNRPHLCLLHVHGTAPCNHMHMEMWVSWSGVSSLSTSHVAWCALGLGEVSENSA